MSKLLAQRSTEEEIMDDFDCSGEVLERTLQELDFINRFLGGDRITYLAVRKFLDQHKDSKEKLRIADLGSGSGDMLMMIARLATQRNIPVDIVGIEANPHTVAYAEQHTRSFPEIQYLTMDVFSEEFTAERFDLVISSLTTHHFTDEQLIYLYRQIKKQSRFGFINNDLHRHSLAYWSIKLLTQLFSKSDMVKNDAPLSVLRGFTRNEVREIMDKAGIREYSLKWRWAFRWVLEF